MNKNTNPLYYIEEAKLIGKTGSKARKLSSWINRKWKNLTDKPEKGLKTVDKNGKEEVLKLDTWQYMKPKSRKVKARVLKDMHRRNPGNVKEEIRKHNREASKAWGEKYAP